MARPTASQSAAMEKKVRQLVRSGMSCNQIGRQLGKSGQAVQQYCRAHGIETAEMRRRREDEEKGAAAENNVDKVSGPGEGLPEAREQIE